jgi:elongation factor G
MFVEPVRLGLQEAMLAGPLAGYPLIGVKAVLLGGQWHESESSEAAFKLAASLGFNDGIRQAGAVIMEPVMEVEVVVPGEFLGDVMSDINARRGRIQGVDSRPGEAQAVSAFVPLAAMFGYSTTVRSLSQGRATFTMQFHGYEPVAGEAVNR